MIIKKIKLTNIRSYKEEEISFPEGSTLLSGNIGSGKSTILLAIDFALFGISHELPGKALLRQGESEGSVELTFKINEKVIIIKRNLKKTPTSVSQESGQITIGNDKQELTAMELKQKIIELLNYPQDLLTKTKSSVYHYTVYSPQEKMKEILLGKKEERLEILRRVFGIDKYKKVRDNAQLFLTALKQKSKEIAARVADLEQKQEELAEKIQRKEELANSISKIQPQIIEEKQKLEIKKQEILFLEEKQKEVNQLKHELEKTILSLTHKTQDFANQKIKLGIINKELVELTEEVKNLPLSDPSLKDKIEILQTKIKTLEDQNIFSQRRSAELGILKKGHEEICHKISELDNCPLCKQAVEEEHKHKITKEETSKAEKLDLELDALKRKLTENHQEITNKKQELLQIQQNLHNQGLVELKQKNLTNKKQELTNLTPLIESTKKEISELTNKKQLLEPKIPVLTTIDTSKQKQELEIINNQLKEFEIRNASMTAELNTLTNIIITIQKEVDSKKTARSNIAKLMQIREWLEKQFINMTILMEKNIMLKVHSELENLIQKWFTMLVDSESIKIRLDEEFTPIIEQNGHETDYLHLSGGEKTAAALSYRLALNQVLNTLMTTINTKNILMLDEPTDGFSQEQLERMRNILEELNTKQTIIVSHDPKVESFVDNVIRLEKNDHLTSIIHT